MDNQGTSYQQSRSEKEYERLVNRTAALRSQLSRQWEWRIDLWDSIQDVPRKCVNHIVDVETARSIQLERACGTRPATELTLRAIVSCNWLCEWTAVCRGSHRVDSSPSGSWPGKRTVPES